LREQAFEINTIAVSLVRLMVVCRSAVSCGSSLQFVNVGHNDSDKGTSSHPLLSVGGTAVPRL